MNKKQKLLSLTLFSILTLGLVGFLSLPYPFTPLGTFLENLFVQKDSCVCLCPWWLFLAILMLYCSLLLKLFRTIKTESKTGYWAVLLSLGLAIFVFHLLVHNFYIGKGVFEASIFCRWFWLMDAVLVFLFGLLPLHKSR